MPAAQNKQNIFITIPAKPQIQLCKAIEKGKKAKFVAQALETALVQEEKLKSLDFLKSFKPFRSEDISVKVLRKIKKRT